MLSESNKPAIGKDPVHEKQNRSDAHYEPYEIDLRAFREELSRALHQHDSRFNVVPKTAEQHETVD